MFAWLRELDSEQWLPVDAYYPRHRLVIVCRDGAAAGDDLIASRVPEHGLSLLWLTPVVVLADPAGVLAALDRELDAVRPAPPPPRQIAPSTPAAAPPKPPVQTSPIDRAVASLSQARAGGHARAGHPERPSQAEAVARGARFVAAHRTPVVPRRRSGPVVRPARPARIAPAPRPVTTEATAVRARERERRLSAARRRWRQRKPTGKLGLLLSTALVLALAAEIYYGVYRWALHGGHALLALGLVLDTCARGLGTIAAGRAGDRAIGWACALGGSPLVAGFALFGPDGPVETDPAPLAGLLGLFACGVLGAALVVAVLGR
jgi:hypothetical protein